MTKANKNSKLSTPINETEKEELIEQREENKIFVMKIIWKKDTNLAFGIASRNNEKQI